MKFRTNVASMCKLGFDLGLKDLTPDDLAYCRTAVANWKRLQSTIIDGNQYRLVSPYASEHMAVSYVSEDLRQAVLFAYDLHPRFAEKTLPVRLEGLDPDGRYMVQEINLLPSAVSSLKENGRVFTGDYLMKVGLNVFRSQHLQSRVIELVRQ